MGLASAAFLPAQALHLLVLHCMTLTRDEIEERKEQLRQEILERECVLAALDVLHKHACGDRSTRPIDVGAFLPALLRSASVALPATQVPLLESGPVQAPQLPRPEPYMHHELKGFWNRHGGYTATVLWAINRLSGDYTLNDIHALLAQEGRPLQKSEISVILTRLKRQRKIVEIQRGNGRKPAVFHKPQVSGDQQSEAAA